MICFSEYLENSVAFLFLMFYSPEKPKQAISQFLFVSLLVMLAVVFFISVTLI